MSPNDDFLPDGHPAWRLERRRKIVAAAGRLFGQAAYDLVQLDQVAPEAGVGKPTLYCYFPSKEDLFLEVADAALTDLEQRLANQRAAEAPPPVVLARMIATLAEGLGRQIASLYLLTAGHSALADRWRRLFNARRRPIVETLRGVIERGVASGDFRAVDPDVVPALILGMIRGGLVGVPKLPQERIVAAAIDLVLHGTVTRGAAGERSTRRAAGATRAMRRIPRTTRRG